MQGRLALALCGSMLLAAVACGGDDGGDDAVSGVAGPAVEGALASVVRIDAAVDAAIAEAEFASVDEAVAVNEGDQVRTDPTGFAEITYFDGSIARLDVDTTLTVTDLADAPDASVIRTAMGAGRTYHRVVELTGDDVYVVETSVATATVRGTAFLITCETDPDMCTFDILDGTVEITPTEGETVTLGTGGSLDVTIGGPGPTQPLDPALLTDDWIIRNTSLDTDAGHPDLPGVTADRDDSESSGEAGAGVPDACSMLTADQVQGFLDELEGGAQDGPWDFVVERAEPINPTDCEWSFVAEDARAIGGGGAFGFFYVSTGEAGRCDASMFPDAEETVVAEESGLCAIAGVFFFYPLDSWDAVSPRIASALERSLAGR